MMKYLLTDIPGIKESTAELLTKHGIDSVQALIDGGERALSMVPGFGAIRSANVLKAAKNLKGGDNKAVAKSSEDGAKTAKKAKKAAKAEAKADKKAEKVAKKATKAAKKEAKKLKKKKSKSKK